MPVLVGNLIVHSKIKALIYSPSSHYKPVFLSSAEQRKCWNTETTETAGVHFQHPLDWSAFALTGKEEITVKIDFTLLLTLLGVLLGV